MKNQSKQHISGRNVILLGTFLSASMISSSAAWAAGMPDVATVQVLNHSTDLVNQSSTQVTDPQVATVFTSNKTLDLPAGDRVGAATTVNPALPNTDNKIAQVSLSDVTGNWAEPFIQVLVAKGIIYGYPDGTFRPDQPVTRAEFAALLNRAFDLPAVREGRTFSDVPSSFWGAAAIDKAYRAGFMAGYPNNTFGPMQNIVRMESLVALANGSRLQPDGSPDRVDELFSDAAQVPSYGRNALLAATQKCVTVSLSYPDSRTFEPNRVATRADVAASIHQVLVAAGRLGPLAAGSPAQKYIVNCGDVAKITEQDVLNRTGIGTLPGIEATTTQQPANAPVAGITTPSAFGANWGDIFIGAGYQQYPDVAGARLNTFGMNAGFGIGNARDLVGLEASYSTNSTGGVAGVDSLSLLNRGGVNFKLHKQVGDNLSVAAGWENAIKNGYNSTDLTVRDTIYGALTGVLPIGDTSNITATVGVGNGRFRKLPDISANRDTTNIFGSVGFRISENVGVVGDYNGRNFSVGLPLTLQLSDNIGLQVTPALLNIAGDNDVPGQNQSYFGIGGGLGFRF